MEKPFTTETSIWNWQEKSFEWASFQVKGGLNNVILESGTSWIQRQWYGLRIVVVLFMIPREFLQLQRVVTLTLLDKNKTVYFSTNAENKTQIQPEVKMIRLNQNLATSSSKHQIMWT